MKTRVRTGGKELSPLIASLRWRFVQAFRQELYNDCNTGKDKFGIAAKKGVK